MKFKLLLVNLCVSFMALGMLDIEDSNPIAVALVFVWFVVSALVARKALRKLY